MRRDQPDLFTRAVELEDLLNGRRRSLGKDLVWLTRFNRPLAAAVSAAQDVLPGLADDTDPYSEGASCSNGACFT